MADINNKKNNYGTIIILGLITLSLIIFAINQQINADKQKEELSKQISQDVAQQVKSVLENQSSSKSQRKE